MYKDITTYSKNDTERKPRVLENIANGVKFTVHKYVGLGDEWFIDCRELGIILMALHTEDMEEAKEKAIVEIESQLNRKIDKYLDAISALS